MCFNDIQKIFFGSLVKIVVSIIDCFIKKTNISIIDCGPDKFCFFFDIIDNDFPQLSVSVFLTSLQLPSLLSKKTSLQLMRPLPYPFVHFFLPFSFIFWFSPTDQKSNRTSHVLVYSLSLSLSLYIYSVTTKLNLCCFLSLSLSLSHTHTLTLTEMLLSQLQSSQAWSLPPRVPRLSLASSSKR